MLRKVNKQELIESFKSFVISADELNKYKICNDDLQKSILINIETHTNADYKKQIIAHTSDGQAGIREHTRSIAKVDE